MTARAAALLAAVGLAAAPAVHAQAVSLDKGVQAAGLWCFPLVSDPQKYVYLPSSARLAKDAAGKPQFSFLRYALDTTGAAAAASPVSTAAGGGILHFLVQLETPPDLVRAAEQALQREVRGGAVVLRGPLIFKEGRYALVSSILKPAASAPETTMLATGRSPVLEGERLAFSFDLEPEKATLLMRSFAMNTPDVSLVFDMTFDGLTEAYDADLTIDWAEVRKTKGFSAGGSLYYVSADVEHMLQELQRTNAIRLRSRGGSGAMEGLLNTTHSRLLELLFRPVEPEQVPPGARGGLMDALAALVNPKKGVLSSRNVTGFGAHVGYQMKELKSQGTSVLTFNHRASAERHSFITFNIGDFHRRFGRDPNHFRAVNLADPTFQKREVRVGIDGSLLPDFERYINAVTVTLRKQHPNGERTVREVVVDRRSAAKPPEDLRMVYGWNGNEDHLAWMNYDYRTRWSFQGGGTHLTDWIRSDQTMINLLAPYKRREVRIVGGGPALQGKKVRAVSVQIEYPFFGERRREQVVVRADDAAEPPPLSITLPANELEYEYAITWQLEGGRRLTARGRDSTGTIFVDELPEDGGI
jgi:hypothetical protein